MLRQILTASALALATAGLGTAPAQALTMKECSARYQAAKEADSLKGQKWNDFRKAQCGGDEDASDADAAAAVADEPKEPARNAAAPTADGSKTGAAPKAAAPAAAAAGKAVFPKAIDAKYSDQAPGKARLNTCVDQYRANKANGGNGELKWIQKGGGYYSQCNAQLKS